MNRTVLSVLLLLCFVPALSALSAAQVLRPRVIQEIRHDVSPAMRDAMRGVAPGFRSGPQQEREIEEPPFRQAAGARDTVVQSSPGGSQQAAIVNSFDGMTGAFPPPDTNGAPGLTQYVQVVNWDYAVFDKATGQITFGPYPITTIFTGFGGACEFNKVGDPTVRFDRIAGRWVIQQTAGTGGIYLICVAVSTTSDATGAYARYSFSYAPKLPDYPKLAVWPDAYYLNSDIYGTSGFEGSSSCALDRKSMLQGGPASAICFETASNVFQLLPADLDGPIPPPAGAPNYQVGNVSASNNTLQLYKFHVDFANPQNSTYTGLFPISVAGYTIACWYTCVPQLGTSNLLDGLGSFMMYRLAYRNFIPATVAATIAQAAHETLVAEHSVKSDSGQVVTRWYEFRAPENGNFTVYQQGTFAPDTYSRWMGSIAMDKKGDIALAYSLSDASLYPSIAFTGRVPQDPLGTMEQEVSIIAGANWQSSNRWGDYSGMVPDPVDDCTLWYTTEYLQAGSQSWKTRVAALKFSSCR